MAPIKPQPRRRKRPQLTSLRTWCKKSWQNAQNFAQRNTRFTGLSIATLLLIGFLLLATLLPSRQPCEGSLTLSSLSFESTTSQPFLLNTPTLSQLDLTGKIPLRLTGQFTDNPTLQTTTSLNLTPLDDSATLQLSLRPKANLEPKASLELTDLSLEPNTQVNDLTYDTYNKRLKFNLSNRPNAKTAHLNLNPNGSLSVQLTNYRIDSNPNLPPEQTFTWQPDNQLTLDLANAVALDIQLTEFTAQPFWGHLAVQNVKLDAPNVRAQNYNTNYRESAILAGSIRLADKTASLETNQFLTFTPTNSIDTLLHLSLSEEKTEAKPSDNQTLKLDQSLPGLKLNFSGKTDRIKIGLNPQNPVLTLQASLLEAIMPRDAVIGLIAFLSTLVMTLIGWLWEIATDSSP